MTNKKVIDPDPFVHSEPISFYYFRRASEFQAENNIHFGIARKNIPMWK